ncbi:hypothetical protein [Streptomyces sp. NPDC093544]|uniref:hypothetical protein n=1 Tax=Streptomyces sp. NPDC093544 TaxID=3155200 RepID=UPI00342CA6DD
MNAMKLWRTIVSMTVAAAAVLVLPAAAEASASTGDYCVQDLAGGPSACFTTERALESYQAELSLSPLLTVYRNTGQLGAGGYLNFASAYGRTYCDDATNVNEASSGALSALKFSTGQTVDLAISSYVIAPNSGCVVVFFDQASFNGNAAGWGGNCSAMASCFGSYWDNRARSLAVT